MKFEELCKTILGESRNEVHDSHNNVTFTVGHEYRLPNGDLYTVDEITDPPNTRIRFTITTGERSGTKAELPLERAAKIQSAFQRETTYELSDMPLNNKQQYFLMGIIAQHGRIEIQAPEKYAADVEQQYQRVTNTDLRDYQNHGYQVIPTEHKWYPSLKITIDIRAANTALNLHLPGLDIKPFLIKGALNGALLMNSKFIWTLITKHHFRVGRNQNRINDIENTVPDEFKDSFIEGVALE